MTTPEPRQIAVVVRDLPDLHRALRARAEFLDISRETIDELAGVPKGYAAKVLCEPPLKQVGPSSMFPIAGALGYAIAFIEDEQRKAITSRISKRKPGGPRGTKWRNARAYAVVVAWGRDGARKMLQNMDPERMSQLRSKAAKARWRKWRKAQRDLRKRPDLMKVVEL